MRSSPLALVALALFTLDCVRAQEDSRQPAAEFNRKFAALSPSWIKSKRPRSKER